MRLFLVTFVFVVFLFISPVFASGGTTGEATLEVEINTGPEFDNIEADMEKIYLCVNGEFTFFPMDLVFNGPQIPEGTNVCPSISFFGYDQEICWVLGLYEKISPFITFGLISYAIFHL